MTGNPHYEDTVEYLRRMDDDPMGPEQWHDYAQMAQIEATLALAHEQRTANLIALATAQWPNGSSMFGTSLAVNSQIRERLGLKAPKPDPEQ